MHYTGTIWRPPYEAASMLLEVTAGCTHHRCKFCTLYEDLPFQFKMTPLETIKSDLKEAKAQLLLWKDQQITRTFLTGANPFVLKASRLLEIADLIRQYFPECKTIGCFSRITDITQKTDEDLQKLRNAGYDCITIGIETGDDKALSFMHKGYLSEDILIQCQRLDQAGIHYHFFYLTGIAGAGQGERSAKASAEVFNRLHPGLIGSSMLTVYPDSRLYQEIQAGSWREAGEVEKYEELKTLVSHLTIPVTFAALGASNAYQFQGELPGDREALLSALDRIIRRESEDRLRSYRTNLPHL